jgi:hypothetical protein
MPMPAVAFEAKDSTVYMQIEPYINHWMSGAQVAR